MFLNDRFQAVNHVSSTGGLSKKPELSSVNKLMLQGIDNRTILTQMFHNSKAYWSAV